MICDEIVSWASTCRDTLKQSSKTCSAGRETSRYCQNRATNYDLQRNRLLDINVSRYTETALENELRRSKNSQVQSKPCYKLWFATKSSPGHQRIDVYQHSPQKRTQRVEKPPGTAKTALQTMFCDIIVSWTSACRGTPKHSSKTYSVGRKTPRYSQNRVINYDLPQNRLLGINVSKYTETVLENVLSVSKNPQVHSNSRESYLLGMSVSPRTGIVVRNVLRK